MLIKLQRSSTYINKNYKKENTREKTPLPDGAKAGQPKDPLEAHILILAGKGPAMKRGPQSMYNL